jgi:hypothetical protein
MWTWVLKALGWAKSALAPIWGKVALWGAIALGIAGTIAVVLGRAKQAGRDEVEREALEDIVEIQDAQKDAIRNRPRTDDDLDKRLRGGTF